MKSLSLIVTTIFFVSCVGAAQNQDGSDNSNKIKLAVSEKIVLRRTKNNAFNFLTLHWAVN